VVLDRDRVLRRGDYIGGSWVRSESTDGYIIATNPADRSDQLGRFPFAEGNVDLAVAAAADAHWVWPRLPANDRAASLRTLSRQLQRYAEPIATLVSRETGKPLWEARQEVTAASRAIDLVIEDGLPALEPRVVQRREAWAERRPHGVVGVITPYNFPILIPALHTAAALLAGNAVILKPSTLAPASGQAFAEAVDRSRFPRGVFNLVQGPGSVTGARLCVHPQLKALLVTGRYETAMQVRAATAHRPELPMLMQSGGKGTALILDDVDLARSAREIALGSALTAGQRHDSTARAIIDASVWDRIVPMILDEMRKVRPAWPADDNAFMGPLASDAVRQRFRAFTGAVQAAGHEILMASTGNGPEGRRGYWATPFIAEIRWQDAHPFLDEEPPGPSLLLYKVDGWEDGVALHNAMASRPSTSVFLAPEHEAFDEVLARLEAGSVHIHRGTLGTSIRLAPVAYGRSSNGVAGDVDLVRFLAPYRATLVDTRSGG
jgi:acyl-CoA reductase-like NAD-dependent aldehyde dehydrogenase